MVIRFDTPKYQEIDAFIESDDDDEEDVADDDEDDGIKAQSGKILDLPLENEVVENFTFSGWNLPIAGDSLFVVFEEKDDFKFEDKNLGSLQNVRGRSYASRYSYKISELGAMIKHMRITLSSFILLFFKTAGVKMAHSKYDSVSDGGKNRKEQEANTVSIMEEFWLEKVGFHENVRMALPIEVFTLANTIGLGIPPPYFPVEKNEAEVESWHGLQLFGVHIRMMEICVKLYGNAFKDRGSAGQRYDWTFKDQTKVMEQKIPKYEVSKNKNKKEWVATMKNCLESSKK
jgi:hypothetical protein